MDRKPALGFWRYGRTFLVSAEMLRQENGDGIYPVDYYLICHSLELGFKAFLSTRSFTLESLKNHIRHDLKRLLDESLLGGLQDHVSLSDNQIAALRMIGPIYKGKQLEYVEPGPKTLPDWELLRSAADSLVTGLEATCRR